MHTAFLCSELAVKRQYITEMLGRPVVDNVKMSGDKTFFFLSNFPLDIMH